MGQAFSHIYRTIMMVLCIGMAQRAWCQEIEEVCLTNAASGISMEVINYGCRIKSLTVWQGRAEALGVCDEVHSYT